MDLLPFLIATGLNLFATAPKTKKLEQLTNTKEADIKAFGVQGQSGFEGKAAATFSRTTRYPDSVNIPSERLFARPGFCPRGNSFTTPHLSSGKRASSKPRRNRTVPLE
jgi:hypothetical protein